MTFLIFRFFADALGLSDVPAKSVGKSIDRFPGCTTDSDCLWVAGKIEFLTASSTADSAVFGIRQGRTVTAGSLV